MDPWPQLTSLRPPCNFPESQQSPHHICRRDVGELQIMDHFCCRLGL